MNQLLKVQYTVAKHLEKILKLFRPGVKITILVRLPADSQADFLMTDDDLDEVIEAVHRRKEAGMQAPGQVAAS